MKLLLAGVLAVTSMSVPPDSLERINIMQKIEARVCRDACIEHAPNGVLRGVFIKACYPVCLSRIDCRETSGSEWICRDKGN